MTAPESKDTRPEGLLLQIAPAQGEPWVGNFELGRTSYSKAIVHPNGRDLVVIAGGNGYLVRPDDRTSATKFGRGGVMGVWPVPGFNFLIFNDSDVAFHALGSDGWRWSTRRISWGGFKGIEIAEKTIYGLAWNAVLKYWQPFRIEIATGDVRGGAYSEAGQQRIARAREMSLRDVSLHPFARRVVEAAIGILAIALVVFAVYLVVDSARTGELTWARAQANWGVAYLCLFLTAVVLVLGVRLVFPSLAPRRRLLTRSGIIALVGLYLTMPLVVYLNTGVVPSPFIAVVAVAVGVFATGKWFS